MVVSRPEAPVVGSWWANAKGIPYQVKAIANVAHTNPDYPPMVVYQGPWGHWWTKPLSQWHEKMTEVKS